MTPWLDRLGGVASATCAVHCLVLSVAPAAASLLGAAALGHPALEWGFFSLAVVLGIAAAVLGFRTHRTWWVPIAFACGVGILIAGRLGEAMAIPGLGVVLSVTGGVVLMASHIASAWQIRRCVRCEA